MEKNMKVSGRGMFQERELTKTLWWQKWNEQAENKRRSQSSNGIHIRHDFVKLCPSL